MQRISQKRPGNFYQCDIGAIIQNGEPGDPLLKFVAKIRKTDWLDCDVFPVQACHQDLPGWPMNAEYNLFPFPPR